jgi:hypothetical protein
MSTLSDTGTGVRRAAVFGGRHPKADLPRDGVPVPEKWSWGSLAARRLAMGLLGPQARFIAILLFFVVMGLIGHFFPGGASH